MNQNGEISGNLKQLRKQYDILRSKSTKKEKEIIKMRNEIDQIKVQQEGKNPQNHTKKYLIFIFFIQVCQEIKDITNPNSQISNPSKKPLAINS